MYCDLRIYCVPVNSVNTWASGPRFCQAWNPILKRHRSEAWCQSFFVPFLVYFTGLGFHELKTGLFSSRNYQMKPDELALMLRFHLNPSISRLSGIKSHCYQCSNNPHGTFWYRLTMRYLRWRDPSSGPNFFTRIVRRNAPALPENGGIALLFI